MTVAELFVNIGIKGSAAVGKALTGVQKGMQDVGSSSLAAKAAIVGVIYGLERLTGHASQIGMDLYKFSVTTGLSTDELQKWEFAANRFDVSGQEMTGTIRGVQQAMMDMKLGKGSPESLDILGATVGFDPARARDTFYVLGQLQKFAKTQPADVASNLLKSFGISDNVFQMLKASSFEVDKINKRDVITAKQQSQLVAVNKAWKDFWFSLDRLGTRLVAQHGMFAIGELKEFAAFVISTTEAISHLTQEFPLLKMAVIAAGIAIAAAFAPITTAVAGVTLAMADIQKYREGKPSVTGDVMQSEGMKGVKERWSDPNKGFFSKLWDQINEHDSMDNYVKKNVTQPGDIEKYREGLGLGFLNKILPGSEPAPAGGGGPITINNYGVTHPKETAEATRAGIKHAFRQRPSEGV